jgi:hypothetical protein
MTTMIAQAAPTALRAEYEASCLHLFRCEQALHDAHQSGVDRWISAAADRLHEAVLRQARAEAAYTRVLPPAELLPLAGYSHRLGPTAELFPTEVDEDPAEVV